MWALFLVIVICVIYYLTQKSEGLEAIPDSVKQSRTDNIMQNLQYFQADSKYRESKNKFPWLDPIVYDTVRTGIVEGNLTRQKVIDAI